MTNAKVIQFPSKLLKVEALRKELYNRMESLEECYSTLEKLHEALHALEDNTHKQEQSFNIILAEYATLVKPEELETVLLTYSTEAIVEQNAEGNLTIKWGEDGIPAELERIEE